MKRLLFALLLTTVILATTPCDADVTYEVGPIELQNSPLISLTGQIVIDDLAIPGTLVEADFVSWNLIVTGASTANFDENNSTIDFIDNVQVTATEIVIPGGAEGALIFTSGGEDIGWQVFDDDTAAVFFDSLEANLETPFGVPLVVAAVPEPHAFAMVGMVMIGLAGRGAYRRRKVHT